MPSSRSIVAFAVALIAAGGGAGLTARQAQTNDPNRYYLPNADNSKIVTVTRTGKPAAHVIIQIQAVATKGTDPETVARFGEVFSFAPATFFVHQDEPTQIEFWNLQEEMDHDFMMMDAKHDVMMQMQLPKYKKTSYVFTFHRQGVFDFTCSVHLPGMNGQIMVVPPR
jgi:plastocyanin